MEASIQLDSVLPFAASDRHSRRGPVVVSVVEVLQPASSGKYLQYQPLFVPDLHSVSSPTHNSMEAKEPPSLVENTSSATTVLQPASSDSSLDSRRIQLSSSIPNPSRPTQNSMEALELSSSGENSSSATTDSLPQFCRSRLLSHLEPESSAGDGVLQAASQGRNVVAAISNVLVYYQNVGGINSSLADYQLALSDGCYDVYALTETWLNANTTSNQLFDESYNVYRQDRSSSNSNKSIGGGVLLAVRSSFKSRLVNPPNSSSVEQIWIALTTDDATLYICVVYLPPDRVNDAALIENHLDSLNWVVSQLNPRDNIIILGDFNLSAISWQRNSIGHFFPMTSHSSINQTSRELLDTYSTAQLVQTVGVLNENSRTLDLCFVSAELCEYLTVMNAPAPLVKICRHHPPLVMNLAVNPSHRFIDTSESVFYDFSKAKFDEMNEFLAHVDWDEIVDVTDVNLAASKLSGVLLYAIDQFVPMKTKREPAKPVWSNSALKLLKRAKQAALRKHSKHRSDSTRASYMEANTKYKQLNDRLYHAYQDRLQSSLKADPKSFWRHVNSQRKESGLPSSMTDGLLEADCTADIADLFRTQFSSVFTDEQVDPLDIDIATRNVPRLDASGMQFAITADMLIAAGKELKSSTGCGPDGIPSVVIKRCLDSLASPLATVFNLSMTTGVYPAFWKESYVFPVFKKGCKRMVSNYRGIASLSAISKLFEMIVLKKLTQCYAHYISKDQHGFVPKRSTTTNLTCFSSYLIRQIESGHQVDAIYTDLSAAFDKMNHQIAIAKFDKLGMNDSFLIWLQSYLYDRRMSVKIGDHVSSPFPVRSGVPQGSHLGPFLFLLYMNDVNFVLECLKLSYADDLKLYYTVKHSQDAEFLQRQLGAFADWCRLNRMSLNVSKCSVITFGRKHDLIHFGYALAGVELRRDTTVKDLGILIDSKVTFKDQVAHVVTKASSQLGFLFRYAKKFKDVYCLKSLYCAIVRPTLEYSSVVWSPYYQNEIQRIEAIQRKFIRFALRHLRWRDRFNLPSYVSRCQLINLETLEARRNVAKACYIGDLLQGNIDCSMLLSMLNINTRRRNLRSHSFLNLPAARTNYGLHEPMRSMSQVFNRCYLVFDFNVSRETNKCNFRRILS